MIRQPKKPISSQMYPNTTDAGLLDAAMETERQSDIPLNDAQQKEPMRESAVQEDRLPSNAEEADIPPEKNMQSDALPDDTATTDTAQTDSAPRRRVRRSAENNRMSLLMSMVFFVFLFLLAILLIVLPRPTESQIERRALAAMPEFSSDAYLSGAFTNGITQFYDDTVPARDTLKNIGNNIKGAFGIASSNSVEVIGSISKVADSSQTSPSRENTGSGDEPEADTTQEDATQKDATQAPTTAVQEEARSKNYHAQNVETVNEDGIIVAFQDGHWRAMSLFDYYYNSLYNNVVNYVRQVISADIHVYFMPIPMAVQFYCPPDYVAYTSDLEQVYKEVSSQMRSGIKCIDMIPYLDTHNAENIYLRTDHHWAPLGAYYAAKYFAETVNVPFADLSKYTQYVNEGYVGTMYAFTGSANILNDPEDFVYYVPTNAYSVDYYDTAFHYNYTAGLFADVDVPNSYSTFMGGDDKIVKVNTDTGNGRRLLLVKDSYGNAMVPFLTSSFETIYVVDQRYFDLNLVNFITYNKITDVLFAHNYFNLNGAEAELLEYITYSNYDEPFSDDAPQAQPEKHTAAEDE